MKMDLVGVFFFMSGILVASSNPLPESLVNSIQDLGETSFNITGEDLNGKVISGYDAVDKQFPFMVNLIIKEVNCSAFIISETHVLTAAHCVVTGNKIVDKSSLVGYTGTVDLENRNWKLSFCNIAVNPGYLGPGMNDIALLTTKEPIRFNDFIKPIPIKAWEPLYPDDLVSIVGCGYENCNKPEVPIRLQTLQFSPRIPVYINGANGFNNLLCYSHEKSGACRGDSGGPWIIETDEGQVAVGVTSIIYYKKNGNFEVFHGGCSEMISVHWNFIQKAKSQNCSP